MSRGFTAHKYFINIEFEKSYYTRAKQVYICAIIKSTKINK